MNGRRAPLSSQAPVHGEASTLAKSAVAATAPIASALAWNSRAKNLGSKKNVEYESPKQNCKHKTSANGLVRSRSESTSRAALSRFSKSKASKAQVYKCSCVFRQAGSLLPR